MKKLFLSMLLLAMFVPCAFSAEKITSEQAQEMMKSQKIVILDVRTKSEFDRGHIKDAILFPHTEIQEQAETIIPNKDEIILLYCRSGVRSAVAAKILDELGYKNVYDLGGISAWTGEIEK